MINSRWEEGGRKELEDWRRERAGGRRDMVVDRRNMVQKYDKI